MSTERRAPLRVVPSNGTTPPGGPFTSVLMLAVSSVVLTGCASKVVTVDAVYFPPPPTTARVVHLKSFNNLNDLVPGRIALRDMFRGRPVSPHVNNPAGIAYHDGHLYIWDTGFGVVHDWSLTTGAAKRLGGSRELTLDVPVAVCVDEGGTVFVADTGRGEVVSFDSTGDPGTRFKPADRAAFKPVAVAAREGRLYVSDLARLRIEIFSTTHGTHLSGFEARDTDGGWALPIGLAAGRTGRLYVSDMAGGRALVFGRNDSSVRTIGRRGNRYGDLGQPKHLAIGPDGVIFVADAEFGHVHLFSDDGQLLMLIGGPDDHPGGTPMPVGVAAAPTLPDRLTALVPRDFAARYYLFVTNAVGKKRVSLFAVGESR